MESEVCEQSERFQLAGAEVRRLVDVASTYRTKCVENNARFCGDMLQFAQHLARAPCGRNCCCLGGHVGQEAEVEYRAQGAFKFTRLRVVVSCERQSTASHQRYRAC